MLLAEHNLCNFLWLISTRINVLIPLVQYILPPQRQYGILSTNFIFFLAKRTKTKEILFLLFSHLSEQIARLLCYVLGRALFTELYHDPVSMEKNR